MNKLKGEITEVVTVDQFSRVKLKVEKEFFLSIVIASSSINPSLTTGNGIYLLFKETDVTLSVNLPTHISIANKIPVTITNKEPGLLLTRIKLDFCGHLINAVVPQDFAELLAINDQVIMLIRSNEIMLME